MIDFSWLFFRADNLMTALRMLHQSVTNIGLFTFFAPDNVFYINTMNLSEKDFFVLLISLFLLMLIDHWKRKKVDIRRRLEGQNIWFRWLVYYGLIFAILIFGVYGPEYDASAFIYFQF